MFAGNHTLGIARSNLLVLSNLILCFLWRLPWSFFMANAGQIQALAESGAAMKLSTETKVYAFFVAAFAGVVVLGFVTYRSTQELIVNDRWVAHTHQVRQSIADLLDAVLEAENRRRDYLFTGDSRYLAQFLSGLDRIPPATKKNNRTHRG